MIARGPQQWSCLFRISCSSSIKHIKHTKINLTDLYPSTHTHNSIEDASNENKLGSFSSGHTHTHTHTNPLRTVSKTTTRTCFHMASSPLIGDSNYFKELSLDTLPLATTWLLCAKQKKQRKLQLTGPHCHLHWLTSRLVL